MSDLSEICPLTFGCTADPAMARAEPIRDGQVIVSIGGVPLPHAGLAALLGAMDAGARQKLLEKGG
jgi:hypothetical protein